VYAIHRLVKGEGELAPLYEEHAGRYKALKEALVEDLDAFISPKRERYAELAADPSAVDDALAKGGERARERAEAKMAEVRPKVGVV
jgi:tryptophanyl-tRNA synthetase